MEGAAGVVKYEIRYRDTLIGWLFIRNGLHRYVPDPEGVAQVRKIAPLSRVMTEGCEWGRPIPFFQERIVAATRFGRERFISMQTDYFVMRMTEEEII